MMALLPGLLAGLAAGAVDAPVRPFRAAVIVGVNAPFDETQSKLRYADDDAARYAELLGPAADHLELLTVLDAESQGLFPAAAARARIPTVAGLDAALERARAAARAARRDGRRAELYFVYVGHGRVRGGEGEVRLLRGALDRSGLTDRVLRDETFDRKHLMVDACSAYLLVNARGEGDADDVDVAFERFLAGQTLDAFPDVGAVLATSGAGPTHEWSRYQGGVFSHELRSALAGAADADGDARVDYAEVEAFLAAANVEVPVLKGRPAVFVHPPRVERAAALGVLDAGLPRLELPAPLAGHYVLEDARGLRYAELHKEAGFAVQVVLLPDQGYALRQADGSEVWRAEVPKGLARLALPLEPRPVERWGRGDTAPPGAFAAPFGPRFMAGYGAKWQADLRAQDALVTRPPSRDPTRPALGWTATALGALGVGLSVWQARVAADRFAEYELAFGTAEVERLDAETRAARGRATGFAVAGGVLLTAGLSLLLWEWLDEAP